MRLLGRGEGGLHSRVVSDVTAHTEDLGGHAGSAVCDSNPVALLGEGVRDRQTDTTVTASHKNGTAHLRSPRSRVPHGSRWPMATAPAAASIAVKVPMINHGLLASARLVS